MRAAVAILLVLSLAAAGYPAGAKLVIVHADDLAVAHSVDRATFAAMDQGAISSASVMVPCRWLSEVAGYARTHPQADLGIHVTLTNEWSGAHWGPVAPPGTVPSLVDSHGWMWSDVDRLLQHARPAEVELEIRAQVEKAKKVGLRPTHLDCHMGAVYQSAALFAAFVKVAHAYGLPFLAVREAALNPERQKMKGMLADRDIVLDNLVMADAGVPAASWSQFYEEALRRAPPGTTELIVHPGYDDAELEAITKDHPAFGAAWRQRDFDVVTSPGFKRLIREQGIRVITWRELRAH